MFRATFSLKEIEKVRVALQNEGWTKVIIAEDWKKVKGQVVKQLSPEENRDFAYYLVMDIEKRQGGW